MTRSILAVLIISLLLALGKYTPLSFFFRLPPLSFTRISSRFLAFSNFSLGLIGGISVLSLLSLLKERDTKLLLVIAISVFHIAQVGWAFRDYHLWVDSRRWLAPPKTVQALPIGARIMSLHQSDRWNKTFLTKGWFGQEAAYDLARNSLDPNSNMIFGIKQLGVYAQQFPKRQEVIQRHMYDDGLIGENIRNLFGVDYIVDALTDDFPLQKNTQAFPDIRVASKITQVRDMNETLGILNQRRVTTDEIFWESVRLPKDGEKIVVINRSFYPGWKAYFENTQVPIYPVNINQQAVIIPQDTQLSLLSFRYEPLSYKLGGVITAISFVFWLIALVKLQLS